MTRHKFDVSVASSVATGVIDVAVGYLALPPYSGYFTHKFPMNLDEARLLRDMPTDAVDRMEAGGHAGTEEEK